MAEASPETDLFASPGGETELAIDPVASMESVVRAVSLKYWSAIQTGEDRRNEDVPVLWRRQQSMQSKTTLADQRWPVVSSNETMAGTDKCCQAVNATSTQFDER